MKHQNLLNQNHVCHSMQKKIRIVVLLLTYVVHPFKDIGCDVLWGIRTPCSTYADLKEYMATDTKVNANNKSELIKLWGIENECIVGADHYTNYSAMIASKSLDH